MYKVYEYKKPLVNLCKTRTRFIG